MHIHRRSIYKGGTSTHAQGTDPRVALIHIFDVLFLLFLLRIIHIIRLALGFELALRGSG